jgi:hypothetical protein
MTKRQVKLVQNGIGHLKRERVAFEACMSEAAFVSFDSSTCEEEKCEYASFLDRVPEASAFAICDKSHMWTQNAEMLHIDVGDSCVNIKSAKWIRDLAAKVDKVRPSFIFSFLGSECVFAYDTCIPYFEFLDAMSTRGISILHVDTSANLRWNDNFDLCKLHRTDCRGNLSFVTNVEGIKHKVSHKRKVASAIRSMQLTEIKVVIPS